MSGPGFCKVLNLEDFADPGMRSIVREVFADEVERLGPRFPEGVEHRKHWEVAQAIRALREGGALREDAEVLGVAAGTEPTIFWLTNHVARVHATDLYLDSGVWEDFADSSMLTDPGRHWSGDWRPGHLLVQHMDARELRYEDESFDAIFSSSSIEHFGGHDDVRAAAAEMHRVLRPGGVVSLSTEFRLEGPSPGAPGCLMFDPAELSETLIEPFSWEPMAELDTSISALTLASAVRPSEVEAQLERPSDWLRIPHLVLRHEEWLWTSMHLALVKPSG